MPARKAKPLIPVPVPVLDYADAAQAWVGSVPGAPDLDVVAITHPDYEDDGPQGLRVTIRRRVRGAAGNEWAEEEAVWPQGWPLPQQGTVVTGQELAGWLEHLEMDLVNGRVLLVLRPA
jgi:hypothetical protein